MESIARSSRMPSTGPWTAITEIPLSGVALRSVRQTTVSRSAPFPSQPVPLETHFFAPEITQSRPGAYAFGRGGRGEVGAAARLAEGECGERGSLPRRERGRKARGLFGPA